MMNWIIVFAAIILLGVLLSYEKKMEYSRGRVVTKTFLSSLFILTALLQPHPQAAYFHLLLAGLIFCLGGDILLALPTRKMFKLGLVSFLLGHVFYIVAFVHLTRVEVAFSFAYIPIALAGAVVFLVFRPHLGDMLIPVLAYIIVISVMLASAWAVAAESTLPDQGRYAVLFGALLFYLSDLFVARHRFVKPEPLNRFIGLPLYYGGQFMLAFSLGLL